MVKRICWSGVSLTMARRAVEDEGGAMVAKILPAMRKSG